MAKYNLGVHYGHNATVAVVKDGELIFCQSEERFNRLKNSTGFPFLTLEYVYKNICRPGEVQSATLFEKSIHGYLTLKKRSFRPFQVREEVGELKTNFFSRSEIKWKVSQFFSKEFTEKNNILNTEAKKYFSDSLMIPEKFVFSIKHHLAHAYSAVPNISSWKKGLVFTLDGQGDYISATVSRWCDGKLQLIQKVDHRNSLGYFYSVTTSLLGMKSNEHEFKVMGLSPYANPKYFEPLVKQLKLLLWINQNGSFVAKVPPNALKYTLDKIFRYQRFDNVAGAIQAFTESLIYDWIKYWVEKESIRDIAVAGGVFMNVKACQKLIQSPFIGEMFVVPSAADESTAIGAAFWGYKNSNPGKALTPLSNLYLGNQYSDAEIYSSLHEISKDAGFKITKPDSISLEVAKLLASNEVVARFSGRAEFGARALGNRSILANPSSFQNIELINSAIKNRDFWMPFTPSILEEDMPRYIINYQRIFAPYMCITFDTTLEARQDLTAAIHPRDKTARPQCVTKEFNAEYFQLILEFKKLTGIGGVLNTSLNLHGEPNVCSPDDAIYTLRNSGLRYLALGAYLIEKRLD